MKRYNRRFILAAMILSTLFLIKPLFASANKTNYDRLFTNQIKSFRNMNKMSGTQLYNKSKADLLPGKSLSFCLSYNMDSKLFNNPVIQNPADDYLSGEMQGRISGAASAKTDWAGLGFLGSIATTIAAGYFMDDMKTAFRTPVGVLFASVSALSFLQGVPAKAIPPNVSRSYREGFSKGYKSSKRFKQIKYCFSGSLVCYVASLLTMAMIGDVIP